MTLVCLPQLPKVKLDLNSETYALTCGVGDWRGGWVGKEAFEGAGVQRNKVNKVAL